MTGTIIIFDIDASSEVVNEIIGSINGKIVGYISSVRLYQIEIGSDILIDNLNDILYQLNDTLCVNEGETPTLEKLV